MWNPRRQVGQGVVPVGQASPRQREHRPHRHLHRATVERVRTPGGQQHGVDPKGGGRAEDRPDVGVVDDVLADHDRPGSLEHLVDGGQRGAGEGRQRATVDVEAGDLLGQCLADHVAGRVGPFDDVGQPVQPARSHQEGPDRVAGLGGAAYDLLALGEEQSVLGLEGLAQLDVAQVAVVGEARVLRVVDLDVRRHAQLLSGSGRAPGAPGP